VRMARPEADGFIWRNRARMLCTVARRYICPLDVAGGFGQPYGNRYAAPVILAATDWQRAEQPSC